jgi:hypothetical protein
MDTLRQHRCSVLPLDEALERLYSGQLPPRAVSLTFDDGGRDFRLRALPVLKEFGYPAVVYLTTYYSLHSQPVFNLLYPYLVWKCSRAATDPSTAIGETMGEPVQAGADYAALTARVLKWLNTQDPTADQKHRMARVLATSAGLDYEELLASGVMRLMTPDEVREVTEQGIRVELHTHRHRTPKTEDLFRREVRENRESIMRFAPHQSKPVHFCYPSGHHSDELYAWLEAEGVCSATTCKSGLANKSSYRLTLPRLIDTSHIDELDFEGWVTGASHLVPRRS